MTQKQIEGPGGFQHHYPRTAVIVTCHARGKDNALAIAWHSPVSQNPPLYGVSISPKRFSYELILEAGEFTVNFLPLEKAWLIAAVGGSSGRSADKFQKFGFTKDTPLKTNAPILSDAYAAYECQLVSHQMYGDHEWFVGKVVATHYREEAFTPSGVLDLSQVNAALFLAGEFYTTADRDCLQHLERARYGKGA